MFDNIGGKIKTLASVICSIGIVLSVIGGIAVWIVIDDEIGALAFLGVAAGGSLLSWTGSFFTYGFGELIDKVSYIENSVSLTNSNLRNYSACNPLPKKQGSAKTDVKEPSVSATFPYNDIVFCEKCGADITNDADFCHVCGKKKLAKPAPPVSTQTGSDDFDPQAKLNCVESPMFRSKK